jgi:hypothetical protein
MTGRLSPEDYRLLEQMNLQGGIARISGGRPRQGADHLVDAGFATSRALNMSDVEYEMTALGRWAFALRWYGIASAEIETIEAHRHDDGLWYVKVSCSGDLAVMMTVGAATKLVEDLRAANADELAEKLQHETDRARRFAASAT